MAYEGTVLRACGLIPLDFSRTWIVAVSGAGPNVCGHLLVHTATTGYYFHVVGDPADTGLGALRGYPMYMNEDGFRRYMRESGKRELKRRPVNLPNPQGAADFIEECLSNMWTWGGIINNCVSFVEEVIAAGGGSWSSASNCPAVATADSLSQRLQDFYARMDQNIRSVYGVP